MSKLYVTPRQMLKVALAISLSILLVGTGIYVSQQTPQVTTNIARPTIEARLATPKPLTAFQLTDHHQEPFNLERLKGKWTLLFFGYTHCPDVCPTTLTELTHTIQQLTPEILTETQFVFVSVDPQRDTPESLAEYVGYFDAHFLAATGSVEALETLMQQLDSKFKLSTDLTGAAIVNHSSAMLLIDPQVRYYARLSAPHYGEEIRAQYLALRADYQHRLTPH